MAVAAVDTCIRRSLEGIIRGTNFKITTGKEDDIGAGLVQQFQLQFQRNLERVYDLASPAFYYIEGPSQGQLQLTKVVGPKGAPKISCDCSAMDITLDAGPTLCNTQGGTSGTPRLEEGNAQYVLKNAIPFGLTGQGNSNNFLIIFGITYMFNDIE